MPNKNLHFEQMLGLADTSIFFFSLYRDNKKQSVRGIVSIGILIICLCSLQVRAQTDLATKTEKPDAEQEHRAELDRWMLTAFEGDPQAQYRVGMLHTNTQFNQPDFEQAVYWYRQAARQGHVLAQYNLGHQYLMGVGVNKNEASAMKWWLEAAKQDHALAQFNIGRAYYLGIGLEQDHKKSKYWFERAADNEEPKSIDILARLGWTEGEIDESVAADFDIKPSSNADVKKALLDNSKTYTPTVAQNVKKPNPASQLAIKEARDRRAVPNLRSKIIPIDLSQTTSVESKPNSGDVSSETDTKQNAQQSSQKPLAKASNPEPKSGPKPKKSKLIITENKGRPGNLKPDERQVEKAPLNKAVAANLGKNLAKIKQAEKPIPIDNKSPVAIYTNPKIRSVLIAIIDDRSDLKIAKAGSQWSSVKSNKGIPVWMHGDYLKLDRALPSNAKGGSDTGSRNSDANVFGSVTGNNVNTRSVPIVSSGTMVGRLNKGERVSVIEKRGAWYRVIGPTRFIAWVKTRDFNAPTPKARAGLKQTPNKFDLSRTDDGWLFQQKANEFTLQLGSFVGGAQTQEYLRRINFSQSLDLHQLGSKTDNLRRTVFLYGTYKNRESAEKRKSAIDQPQAWVRTLGGLQKNRCQQWREQKPAPEELQRYCKQ